MEHLPNDPMMLFSAVNMLLRDDYSSLDALCDDMNVNRKDIENKLAAAGFEYNEKQNKDVYMVALRKEGKLIGYYEKHEYRDRETMKLYDLW